MRTVAFAAPSIALQTPSYSWTRKNACLTKIVVASLACQTGSPSPGARTAAKCQVRTDDDRIVGVISGALPIADQQGAPARLAKHAMVHGAVAPVCGKR